jgi:chromosome segregation ATPase
MSIVADPDKGYTDFQEVLQLRDREASLRRRLMEHWAGVMAWEVRRLERVSNETQARFNRQSRHIDTSKEREADLLKQLGQLESEISQGAERMEQLQSVVIEKEDKMKELEEMVVDMGRRERGVEEECRELEKQLRGLQVEKEGWEVQRHTVQRDNATFEAERQDWKKERDQWTMHKKVLADEMDKLVRERQRMLESGKMGERDRAALGAVRDKLGDILRRQNIPDDDLHLALGDVHQMVQKRDKEVATLRDELQEVNMTLEQQVRQVRAERDTWKAKAVNAESGHAELPILQKKIKVSQV